MEYKRVKPEDYHFLIRKFGMKVVASADLGINVGQSYVRLAKNDFIITYGFDRDDGIVSIRNKDDEWCNFGLNSVMRYTKAPPFESNQAYRPTDFKEIEKFITDNFDLLTYLFSINEYPKTKVKLQQFLFDWSKRFRKF